MSTFPSHCACTALRKASRAVTRIYDEALDDRGVTASQYALLRTLRRLGPTPLSRLAEIMVMDRTSLYRMLAPVEARGLVTAAAGAGRARIATLAAAGAALLDESDAAWARTQERFVATLGADKWRQLESLLDEATVAAERNHA